MSKRGFTLIELLAIVLVLAGIFTIVVPQINKATENRKESQYEELIASIESAAKVYVSDFYEEGVDTIPKYISLTDLVNEKYIDYPIINPKNGEEINLQSIVSITPDADDVLVYKYVTYEEFMAHYDEYTS